jgi:hypothetical protein
MDGGEQITLGMLVRGWSHRSAFGYGELIAGEQ